MRCNWSISAVTLGVTSTEKMRQNYSWSSLSEELYTALRHAHTDKKINVTSTHLCPSFLALLCSICDPPYVFFFKFLKPVSFVFWDLCNSFFSSNHTSAFFPHPHSALAVLLFHSFIFYCFSGNSQSSHRAGSFPHYNLSRCFYLHSTSLPS